MTQRGTRIDGDRRLIKFHTYEEYLDSLVTTVDLCYLRSTTVARSIAGLGYRRIGETLNNKEFYERLKIVQDLLYPSRGPYDLYSELITTRTNLQEELALRERANKLGTLMTILFLRHFTKSGFEVSGYIDYRNRLNQENFTPFFEGKKKLCPVASDLAFYHWRMGKTTCNDTPNFQSFIDKEKGLVFKNLHDRCIVFINPEDSSSPGTSTTRVHIKCDNYEQVVFYDHIVRRKL